MIENDIPCSEVVISIILILPLNTWYGYRLVERTYLKSFVDMTDIEVILKKNKCNLIKQNDGVSDYRFSYLYLFEGEMNVKESNDKIKIIAPEQLIRKLDKKNYRLQLDNAIKKLEE